MTLINFLESVITMIDKIMAAFKPKQAAPADVTVPEVASAENTQVDPKNTTDVQDPAVVADMASKLEAYVYDPEVAQELAPVFVAMSAVDGFDKVMELLDAKEKQIEAVAGNTPQQSTPEVKKQTVVKPQSAAEILKARNQ